MPETTPRRPAIMLASQSPRRRRLLSMLGLPFEVAQVDTPEELETPLASDPPALAIHLAAEKAAAAREHGLSANRLVLCFDTIVVHEGRVLGKPRDVDDAWRMLRELSGRTHQVVTGCALLCPDEDEPRTFAAVTDVAMKELSDADIEAWMAHGTFLGCAGAYNIEAQVAEVGDDACYQNVAGLALCHLYAAMKALPEHCSPGEPTLPAGACDASLRRSCKLAARLTA